MNEELKKLIPICRGCVGKKMSLNHVLSSSNSPNCTLENNVFYYNFKKTNDLQMGLEDEKLKENLTYMCT